LDDNYARLANAVIEIAADDYRTLKRRERLYMNKYEQKLNDIAIEEIERFFLSDYGYLLCRGLNEVILEKLQAEFE
jgi:hypothetical protein